MKSIGTKLAVTFIAIFLFVIVVISSVLIIFSRSSVKDLTLMGMEYRMELQAKSLSEMFLVRASVIESLAKIIKDEDIIDKDYIDSLFVPLFESNDEYNLYVGFADNRAYFADGWEPDSSWIATERDWYIEGAANPGKVISTTPYFDEQTDEICFSLVYGIEKNGQVIGVVALDIFQDTLLNTILDPRHIIEGQYSMLLDSDGYVYYHPEEALSPSKEGLKNLLTIDSEKYSPIINFSNQHEYVIIKNINNIPSYFVPAKVSGTDWIVCGVVLVSELEKQIVQQIWITVSISGIVLITSILIVIYVVRKMITRPIRNMVNAARVMATGDLNVTINSASKDEMGDFGRAFEDIIIDTKENVKTVQAVANGDLTQVVRARSEKDAMSLALIRMLEKNNEIMREILKSSEMVSDCSSQISDISQSLAAGSMEQSASVEKLSSNVLEISDLTRQNMKQSLDTVNLGDEIIKDAEHGGELMSEMLKAVEAINESSKAIGNVIKTIDDIAFQTNILALNASVEAARAGEHGKGFAVVAAEVRNLASKSAEAAKNTSSLISDSVQKAEFGSRLAGQTAESFEKIVEGLHKSTENIKEISEFSEKQVNAIGFIETELQAVSRVAQQNSASAEEAAAASEEMNGQSNMLEESIAQFKLKDEHGLKRKHGH